MLGAALMSWIATAGVGATLLATWLERGGLGSRGRVRFSSPVLVAHISPAVVGLVVWLVYVITGITALAWVACALLVVVAAWGIRNFWLWQRRRVGVLRATVRGWNVPPTIAADPNLPAEQHFPVAVVFLHGLLGVTTLTLCVLTAIGV